MVIYRRWGNVPLSRVVGDSPRETLLNFYAVMARIYDELQLTTQSRNEQTGLFWNSTARKHIATAEELFALAIQSLDASIFPESVRSDMAQEAAIQLKEVLDYVLTHSTVPIRADSKSQQGSGCGLRRAIASSAVMSCITACIPARID